MSWIKTAVSLAILLWTIVALSGQKKGAEPKLPMPTGEFPVGRKSYHMAGCQSFDAPCQS